MRTRQRSSFYTCHFAPIARFSVASFYPFILHGPSFFHNPYRIPILVFSIDYPLLGAIFTRRRVERVSFHVINYWVSPPPIIPSRIYGPRPPIGTPPGVAPPSSWSPRTSWRNPRRPPRTSSSSWSRCYCCGSRCYCCGSRW